VTTADLTHEKTTAWVQAWFGGLEDICPVSHALEQGIDAWRCTVPEGLRDLAAWRVAVGIAARKLAVMPDLFGTWLGAASGASGTPVSAYDADLMDAYGLLVDIGTAAAPASDDAFYGLLGESVLHELLATFGHGLGKLAVLEGHDWSSMDKGGDKLAIYGDPGARLFRLWESKMLRSTTKTAGDVVKGAADQLDVHAASYIGRFSASASRAVKDEELAGFIAAIPRLWVDRDPCGGIGVSVTTHDVPATQHPFGQLRTHFNLPDSNKGGQLTLLGDVTLFGTVVKDTIWKGMA
jgi:hypothetical protein